MKDSVRKKENMANQENVEAPDFGMRAGLLQLREARVADSLRLLVVGHVGRLGRAVRAENLAAIPAVVFPVAQVERACAGLALADLGVVRPFSAGLFGQLNLEMKISVESGDFVTELVNI